MLFLSASVFVTHDCLGNSKLIAVDDAGLSARVKEICIVLNVENLFSHMKIVKSSGADIISTQISGKDNRNLFDVLAVNTTKLSGIFNDQSKFEIALDFCIAHEIEHLIANHNIGSEPSITTYSEYLEELECDKTGGKAVALLYQNIQGNILEQILPEFIYDAEQGETHPPLVSRVMSAKSGWIEAKIHTNIDFQVHSATYNPKKKKYDLQLAAPSEIWRILTNSRFLSDLNTYEDDKLYFKIKDFNDGSISFVIVKPKFRSIVKNKELSDEGDDESLSNFYNYGNDYTLYTSASFMYKYIPGKERSSTEITFVYNGTKYQLKYAKNSKGEYISFTDFKNITETIESYKK